MGSEGIGPSTISLKGSCSTTELRTQTKTTYYISEPTVPILEHLFDNVISISQKLDELGFTYYNGKVAVIEENKEEDHV